MDVRRQQLVWRLDEMEKIIVEIVDDGLCGDDFEMAVAVNAIEYEIC